MLLFQSFLKLTICFSLYISFFIQTQDKVVLEYGKECSECVLFFQLRFFFPRTNACPSYLTSEFILDILDALVISNSPSPFSLHTNLSLSVLPLMSTRVNYKTNTAKSESYTCLEEQRLNALKLLFSFPTHTCWLHPHVTLHL